MQPEDFKEILLMLISEGYKPNNDMYPANTYIWDDNGVKGFFHFRIEQNLPALKNFVIKKEFRNIDNARMLIKKYTEVIGNLGFRVSFIQVKKEYLKKLIKYYFKILPYKHEEYGYLVEV